MQFEYNVVSSRQKLINDFIYLKLIVSNMIKTEQVSENKISPINGILVNGVLISNLLSNLLTSFLIFNKPRFFYHKKAQFHVSINLFYLVLLTLVFSFVVFFWNILQHF